MGEGVKDTLDNSILDCSFYEFMKSIDGKLAVDRTRIFPEDAVVENIKLLRDFILFYKKKMNYSKEKIVTAIFRKETKARLVHFLERYCVKGLPWSVLAEGVSLLVKHKLQKLEKLEDFSLFPSYYTFYKLFFDSILDDENRKIDSNDWNDLKCFAVAIPYSDIVIIEEEFCQIANKAGLDEKFETIIRDDLDYLSNISN